MIVDSSRSILILYGSETGNAQDAAEELGRIFQRLRWNTTVEELNAVELSSLLQHKFVIFSLSTTGQGDIPHNGLLFWRKLLRKKLPPGCLDQLRYTCFGLGDSTYVKFNWAARKLIRRLEHLGAQTFFEICEADEQFNDGIEGSFVQWTDKLRKFLQEEHPHPEGLQPIADDEVLPAKWSLEPAFAASPAPGPVQEPQPAIPAAEDLPPVEPLSLPKGWAATISEKKRLTPKTHWQDVQLVSFDIPSQSDGTKLRCVPGDCLTIYPKNFPSDVQRLLTAMDWTSIADQPLDLSLCPSLPRGLHTLSSSSCTTTLRTLLLHNIDFTAVPRRSFLKNMSYFSDDEYHKERLLEFTMTDYLDEYFDYATRSRRSIIEVLEEFHSVKIPAHRLLDIFPLIRGRDFSVANGGSRQDHPSKPDTTRIELLIAMVRYKTVLRKPRQGLCSRYLANVPEGTSLHVTHKPVLTPIHGPANAQRPLIAMATGTGLAPVRALIHERLTHPSSAPTTLFFGNRNRSADYLFEEEWPALNNVVVHTAFSRDQREKIYVQDLVRKEAPYVADVIEQGGIFAVCGGSSKMAESCKCAVFDPYSEAGADDVEIEARKQRLESTTWWQEIW
ncbi:flavodoxin domain-containing protein [Sarocladium implicatum]|nr:flavodoxin domain-containing protein [Sarocladium implicatum]